MLDSVTRSNKMYYSQTLSEEFKYEITKKKVENLINDDLDSSLFDEFYNGSNSEADNGSNDEIDNESDNDESNK